MRSHPHGTSRVFGFGALIALSLASLACATLLGDASPARPPQLGDATAEALAATQAAVLTAVVQATATEPVAAVVPAGPGQGFREDFDQELAGWSLEILGDSFDSNVSVTDGRMRFEINEEYVYSYWFYDLEGFSDVQVSASVVSQGSQDNFITLVCRESDAGWYEFNIASLGAYDIYYYDQGVDEFRGIESGESDAIQRGSAANQIRMVCQGNQLSLYVNDQHVTTVTDNRLSAGRIGFAAGSLEELPVVVEFDWLEVDRP